MKLFVGEPIMCSEVKEWSVEKYGYIDYIMLIYDKKDDDGKYIDEIIKGPFIVHHFNVIEGSVTFVRVDPDNEYTPNGFEVTITSNILSSVMNVFISIMDTNIHLFPHTFTVNPEIFKMWENCEKDNSDMYLKYHDPKSDKNMLVQVWNMSKRGVVIYYAIDFEYHRDHLPKSNEYSDLDVEVIVW